MRRQRKKAKEEPASDDMVRLPAPVRRWLVVHRHHERRGPSLSAAQCRDRLSLHPQPATRLSRLRGGPAQPKCGVERRGGNQGDVEAREGVADPAGGLRTMIPLYQDPCYTFRFAEDRTIPRFHLEGVEFGWQVSVYKIDPKTGERLGLLATATVGEGGWVDLAEPIIVRASEVFIAVPEETGSDPR